MRSLGVIRSCAVVGRATALACVCIGALALSAHAQSSQPFSTPNISLSTNASGKAAQFSATSGRRARGLL